MMLTKLVRSAPHDVQVIEVIGRVDGTNCAELSDIVNTALNHDRSQVLLDLHAVDYINSTGLRTLVQLHKLVTRRGGRMLVINPTENVQRLFALVGLDSVFSIHYDARWSASAVNNMALPDGSRETCYSL